MAEKQIYKPKLGGTVSFKDEHGRIRTGEVVNLEPAGSRSNGVAINVDDEVGSYIRKDMEVTPEETSERLRVEFGSALAEAQGVAEFAPKEQGLIQRDGYSEYVRGGETIHYIVHLGDYAHVKISPTQGVFDVEVYEVRFADVTVFPDDKLPAGVVPGEAYIEQRLKKLDVTVEDVQKTLGELDITIPTPLVETLSEWRRKFFESEAYAEAMHMAATESGDSDGRLTPEEVEMLYGPEERLRLFGSIPAKGD